MIPPKRARGKLVTALEKCLSYVAPFINVARKHLIAHRAVADVLFLINLFINTMRMRESQILSLQLSSRYT